MNAYELRSIKYQLWRIMTGLIISIYICTKLNVVSDDKGDIILDLGVRFHHRSGVRS